MMKTVARLVLAASLAAICAGTSLAAGPADELITARQDEMKANMKAMKALVAMLKGEAPYETAAVQAAAKAMQEPRAAGEASGVWDASAATGSAVKTGARPEIWTDAAGFTAAWKTFDAAVATLAASPDEAAFKAAFPAVGAACKGCHEKFRAAE